MREKKEPSSTSWLPLVISIFAVLGFSMDGSMLPVGASNIAWNIGTKGDIIILALALNSAIIAGLTAAAGKMSDIYGKRKMLFFGLGIFIIGSTFTALSVNGIMFLISWAFLKTIGAIFILPTTAALLIMSYEGNDRATAFGLYGAIIGLGIAMGPLTMGIVSDIISWRLAFAITISFMIIAFILLIRFNDMSKYKGSSVDWTGAVILLISLFSIVYGISQIDYWYLIFIGSLFLCIFIYWSTRLEREKKHPIFRISLFKNRQFASSVLTNMILRIAIADFLITFLMMLFTVGGYFATDLAVIILPYTLAIFFASIAAGSLGDRFEPKFIIVIGFIMGIIGLISLDWILEWVTDFYQIVPSLILGGVGAGMIIAWLQNIALSSLKPEDAGEGSGVFNTAQDLGVAFGIVIVGWTFNYADYALFFFLTLGLLIALTLPRLQNKGKKSQHPVYY